MRKMTLLAVALFAAAVGVCQTPYWKDVATVQVNREAPTTEFVTYSNRDAALSRDFAKSDNYQLLNGVWKFKYFDAYGDVPASVVDPSTDASAWSDIKVPGNWERQGFGTAIYVNHPYEFKPYRPQPPILPEENPVGVYRRTFTVAQDWADKDIYLNICGAKSGVYVYINGKEVGYNEDSKTLAKFHINEYLTSGENSLVLKIFRWSTGSYLECQDFWRISGIERDVYLSAQAKSSIKDFYVTSTLDSSLKDGIFGLKVERSGEGECTIGYELLDAEGKVVATESRKVDGKSTTFSATLPDVKKWSAEQPNLYSLVMSISADGKSEYLPFNVGFRRFEIKELTDRHYSLLVNGEPIKFKGVNVHEHNEYTGHYISEEDMRRDLETMRQNNINAVRTAHYPQPRRFYELCDEIGIYVYCEANIESHGMGYDLRKGASLGNNPDWRNPHLDRINNMFEIYKNYPCVAIWSLGNEAGNGYNFYLGYDLVKAKETALNMGRPVCYERAQWEWNSDMYVPQYPGASWFEHIGKSGADRPIVPSEYAHAMGNSTGGLWLQWQSIYRYDNLQGGFIWDWIDQGFAETDENGVKYWAYGGDYGVNPPSDANFLCNGIVGPDRNPHPAMAEVKYAYSDIAFEKGAAENEYNVVNRFYFKDLSGYTIRYTYLADGKAVKSGEMEVDVAPQSKSTIKVPAFEKMRPELAYTLKFEAVTKQEERLIPAGFVIAHESFEVSAAERKDYAAQSSKPLKVSDDANAIVVSGGKLSFTYDKSKGYVTSYKYGGKELLADGFGLRPNFWRAPTDNDFGNSAPIRCEQWRKAGEKYNAKASVKEGDNGVELKVEYALPYQARLAVTYTINAAGFVNVKSQYEGVKGANLPELPRLGMRLRLPREMEQFSYYGRGPEENYWDRNNGTLMGYYTSNAAAENYPYVRPQETGHHTDTEWIRFKGLEVVADDKMEFNLLANTIEEYDPATNTKRDFQRRRFHENDKDTFGGRRQMHINDIDTAANDFVELSLDYRQTGVGGYDSWGSMPEEIFTLRTDGVYEWGFTLIPR